MYVMKSFPKGNSLKGNRGCYWETTFGTGQSTSPNDDDDF